MKVSDRYLRFYSVTEAIMKLSILNLFWILFNVPVLIICANIIFSDNFENLLFYFILLIFLLPVLFFSSTTALFASIRESILKKDKSINFKLYCHFFRGNFKKSVLSGFILTFAWSVWAADFFYFAYHGSVLSHVFLIIGTLFYAFSVNFFSISVHYDVSLLNSLKKTLLITFGSPTLFLKIIIGSFIVIYISIFVFRSLFFFFTGSLIAFLSFRSFYKCYLKFTCK